MKLVDGGEFDVAKKTVASTKLNIGDAVSMIYITDAASVITPDTQDTAIISSQIVVLQTVNGYFLKFHLSEIPEKKKGAAGVRGIRLEKDDRIDDVFLVPEGADITIDYKGKELSLKKLKMAKRDGKGVRIRA